MPKKIEMDKFAALPAEERKTYFQQAAERHGRITAQLMEKDFWVCWTLKRLFELSEFCSHLTFKGGTSLSKVYNAIDRFSEDIDISIERDFLGFGGEKDPEKGTSGKEQQRRIDRLKESCQSAVTDALHPQLRAAIAEKLGANDEWELALDANDADSQTLLFQFPRSIHEGISSYFAPSVKIEIGARSDHFPVEDAKISAYVTEIIPDIVHSFDVSVRVLQARRTFWEKATILHMLYHCPDQKPFPSRMSRHYYDLFQLANSGCIEPGDGEH